MVNIIWNRFSEKEKAEYIEYLQIFGALSGLFKDNREGTNAKKPYLYYRNHEQLYARVFEVEDLTRKDSAFDALGVFGDERIGIGLKTWIHTKDFTFQKVAEFNKLAPREIYPLVKDGTPNEVILKIAELRNNRIMLDKRLHDTTADVYHYVTRNDNCMNIVESAYDLIQLDSLKLISADGKTFSFTDGLNAYKFYMSKSVLLKQFSAKKEDIIKTIPVEQFDDPFELIRMIKLPQKYDPTKVSEEIYLPLYQDKKDGPFVSECSGVNIRHSKSKNPDKPDQPRPEFEIEVRISKWIHHVFPNFFGINALNDEEVKKSNFNLILPDGRILEGRVKQQNGKSLQTNPQGALGEWVLKDVLGLSKREKVTWKWLNILGIDSLKVTKIDNKNFKVTVAETGAYEKFKLEYQHEMELLGLRGKQLPYFHQDWVEQLNG